MEIISRGRAVKLTDQEIREVPLNNWHRYNQLRLTLRHHEAIKRLTRSDQRITLKD